MRKPQTVPERRWDHAPSTGASWLHLFSTLSCLACALVPSLTISPCLCCSPGAGNLLCIDTNMVVLERYQALGQMGAKNAKKAMEEVKKRDDTKLL